MKTATIVLPSGYATAEEFAKDCGFELPAVPALGTPVAWQCIDERREFRYIKGIVSVDKETVEAWKDVGIAFVGLGRIDVPAQGTPASRWREKGEIDPHGTRYDCERASTAGGHLTDDEVANAVFLDPSIQNLTIAKDRIRWLSRKLAEALAERMTLEQVERVILTGALELNNPDLAGHHQLHLAKTTACKIMDLGRQSPAANETLSHGWRRQDEIARIIDKHVRSEPDKNFIDRRWLVGVSEAAAEIAALGGSSQPVTASQREIAINLLGWPSPEKAAEALLSKFNVTCKTTEEPRG